jgi:hypothetical protein
MFILYIGHSLLNYVIRTFHIQFDHIICRVSDQDRHSFAITCELHSSEDLVLDLASIKLQVR